MRKLDISFRSMERGRWEIEHKRGRTMAGLTMMSTKPRVRRKAGKKGRQYKLDAKRILYVVLSSFGLMWVCGSAWIILSSSSSKTKPWKSNIGRRSLDRGMTGNGPMQGGGKVQPFESPLLIFTCHRAEYLTRALNAVFENIPRTCTMGCPIVVSQDGTAPDVAKVIQQFQKKFKSEGIPLIHMQKPDQGRRGRTRLRGRPDPYALIAAHFGWALERLFSSKAYTVKEYPAPQRVIILEEDLQIAPDFFQYFEATAPLLDQDPDLFAVSAFNDNGQDGADDNTRLLRSDFFPGLGWMMNRKLWVTELSSKWPPHYWDDWLREPAQRKERHVIRPEVSRTFHFGVIGGASSNQFGDKLSNVHLNHDTIDWKSKDVSYLEEDAYDREYWKLVSSAKAVNSVKEALGMTANVRIEYNSLREFQVYARKLKLMDDEKAGIPRTAYKGIVETRPHIDKGDHHFLFLTPPMKKIETLFSHI